MEKNYFFIAGLSFVITVLILYIFRPGFILKVNSNHKHIVDWSKLLFVGFLASVLVSICTLLYAPGNDPVEYISY